MNKWEKEEKKTKGDISCIYIAHRTKATDHL